jgi:hypothetical protein
VAAIHAAGAHAVCYVDAGTWEDFRPDAGAYPASVKGLPNGWPGEVWLDIRATGVLLPIIDARVAKCAAAGFDAVEFDNVDGYTNDTGFALTAADQLTFNEDLANYAHTQGLSVGLKNDLDQLGQLQNLFDFAINEQCAQYKECDAYNGWTAAGRARGGVPRPPGPLLPERRSAGTGRDPKELGAAGQTVEALPLSGTCAFLPEGNAWSGRAPKSSGALPEARASRVGRNLGQTERQRDQRQDEVHGCGQP